MFFTFIDASYISVIFIDLCDKEGKQEEKLTCFFILEEFRSRLQKVIGLLESTVERRRQFVEDAELSVSSTCMSKM